MGVLYRVDLNSGPRHGLAGATLPLPTIPPRHRSVWSCGSMPC